MEWWRFSPSIYAHGFLHESCVRTCIYAYRWGTYSTHGLDVSRSHGMYGDYNVLQAPVITFQWFR